MLLSDEGKPIRDEEETIMIGCADELVPIILRAIKKRHLTAVLWTVFRKLYEEKEVDWKILLQVSTMIVRVINFMEAREERSKAGRDD